MKTLILCGGLGTRLRSAVADRPKSLAPIAHRPFLAWTLDALRSQNQYDFVLSAGYMAEQIEVFAKEYQQEVADPKLRIEVIIEPKPLGTGGAIYYAIRKVTLKEPFLVLNGDTFFSGSVAELIRFYAQKEPMAAISVTQVADSSRYGRVMFVPERGHVTGFEEKNGSHRTSSWINSGQYLLNPTVFDIPSLPDAFSLEQDIFPRLSDKQQLYALTFPEAFFLDIGTPEDYARAEALLPVFRETHLTKKPRL
ncbi:MAG TPA: nucleotidyltransferase family protein [Rhodothermales bacterium]|nr:nucleotidyltransferase family protein [Rhodothermales bacterium]HRR09562.1 nucleotidyltransferase family protein [Rhodothermales bacterium]